MTRGSGAATGGSGGGASGSMGDSGRASKGGSSPSKGGSKASGASVGRDVGDAHLCTFIVNGQRFALSTSLVRELVEVTSITKVPRTDSAVLGLFNLRGQPMPLVDMAMVLGTGTSPASEKMAVIILRSEGMSVGARIDALGTVVPNSGIVASSDPNPLVLGFLPPRGTQGPVAVINPADLLARLDRLKRATSER